MTSNYRQRSLFNEDDEDDDEDIATVYSKEYSQMAAKFNIIAPTRTISSTSHTVKNGDMKIVGVDPTNSPPSPLPPAAVAATTPDAPKGATSRIIQPLDMDLEWTTYRTMVDPKLLIPPTPKVVVQPETNPPPKRPRSQPHPPVSSPSVTTDHPLGDSLSLKQYQRGGCNRRWIVVLLLAGICLMASILAIGFSILHQQAQQQKRASPSAVATANSPENESGTISPMDLLSNRPAADEEPADADDEELSTSADNTNNTTVRPTPNVEASPSYPPVRTFSPTPEPAPLTEVPSTTTAEIVKPLYDTKRVVVALIGNTPYNQEQEWSLSDQLTAIDSGEIDFVVHLGNLRDSTGQRKCKVADITAAAEVLQQSPVPVFVLLGDNDWLNCANDEEALSSWEETFSLFQQQYWSTRTGEFAMVTYRTAPRPTSFAMEYNEILFVGLTLSSLVDMESADDWTNRLQAEYNWTQSVIQDYERRVWPFTGRVVLMGHANPSDGNNNHHIFFDQLANYMALESENPSPIVYINGNGETWAFERDYYSQPSLAHLIVPTGQLLSIPTIGITADGYMVDVSEAFVYDTTAGESDSDDTFVVMEQASNGPPGRPRPEDESMTDDDQSDDAS